MSRLMVAALVFSASLMPGLVCSCPAAEGDRPPNIVLIVSDDQGYNDLGVLNDEVISPNLDRLARQGTRLTNFYVAWPACTPSRGALLTGRYPQRNGIYDMIRNEAPDYGHKYTPAEYAVTWERIGGMDEREVLLPKLLGEAGYLSAIFGKWDLGMQRRYLPLQRGFDEFYGFVNTGIDYFTHERYGVPSMYSGNSPTQQDRGAYCTTLFEREAKRFVQENRDRPFFLYLPFNAPHGASSLDPAIRGAAQAPEEYKGLFPHLKDDYVERTRYGVAAMSPGKSKQRLEYLASIACMDAAIGSVLNLLDEYQIASNTIVIFMSDNGGSGGSSNTPLRGGKSQLFEGGIRVCGLVRGPGIPAAGVCNEFLTALDWFPTLLAQAGVAKPEGLKLDGFDVWPTLTGSSVSPRSEMFWKRQGDEAARVDRWKWIRQGDSEFLFDMDTDVGEKNNLIGSHVPQARVIRKIFADWVAEMDAAEPRGPFRDY